MGRPFRSGRAGGVPPDGQRHRTTSVRAQDAWGAGERDGAARGGGGRPIARRSRSGRGSGLPFDWAAAQMNLGNSAQDAR